MSGKPLVDDELGIESAEMVDDDLGIEAAPEAPAPRPSRVINMPVQNIEGDPYADEDLGGFLKRKTMEYGPAVAGMLPGVAMPSSFASRVPVDPEAQALGYSQGATFNWGDEASPGLVPDAPNGTGIPITYAEGSPRMSMERGMKRMNADAKKRSPFQYGVGEAVGGTVATAPLMAANPAGLGARLALNTGTGAAMGGVTAAGGAEDGSRVDAAEGGAMLGGGIGAGMTLAGAAAQKYGPEFAQWLRSKANINRVAATGRYGAQLRNDAQNHGEQWIQDLGEDIEAAGLHKGEGPLGFLPQPPETYGRNAQELQSKALSGLTSSEDAIASGANPRVDTGSIAKNLRDEATRASGMVDPAGEMHVSFAGKMADRFDDATRGQPGGPMSEHGGWNGHEFLDPSKPMPSGQMPFDKALENRRFLDSNINWSRKGGYEGAGMQEQVRRGVAGDMRAGIREAIDGAEASGEVPAELAEQWRKSMKGYALSAAVEEPAMARVYQEYGNQKIGLPGFMAAQSGASIAGGPGALAGAAAGQLVKTRGAAALAGAQRAGQRMTEGAVPAVSAATSPVVQGIAEREAGNSMMSMARAQTPASTDPNARADGATSDHQYGAMLEAYPQGTSRNVAYGHLTETDPSFAERERLRLTQNKGH